MVMVICFVVIHYVINFVFRNYSLIAVVPGTTAMRLLF